MTTASDGFGADALIRRLTPAEREQRLHIGYSGGADSLALLLAAASAGLDISAVHVDHGLHADSRHWAALCARTCGELGVAFLSLRVNPDVDAGLGLEGAARQARYEAFAGHVGSQTLVTAHHADDQAETVLLRLLRGSGPRGLAAMRRTRTLGRGTLLRPLLDVPHAALLRYAESSGYPFVTDPANSDWRHDRSWLRHEVIPLLEARRGGVSGSLGRVASLAAAEQDTLCWLVRRHVAPAGEPVPVAILGEAPERVRLTVLRAWLIDSGFEPPPEPALRRGLIDLMEAAPDRLPALTWSGGQVRRYRGALYALPTGLPAPLAEPMPVRPGETVDVAGVGRLQWSEGDGLRRDCTELVLRARSDGETMPVNGHRRRLKELLRAAGVPPWERAVLPVLSHRDRVVAVPGIAVADGWRDGVGGLMPRWRRVVP